MAEYLFATVSHLEQMGVHDSHLWTLQELVAARIEEVYGAKTAEAVQAAGNSEAAAGE
jgi:cation transport regulator ChaC